MKKILQTSLLLGYLITFTISGQSLESSPKTKTIEKHLSINKIDTSQVDLTFKESNEEHAKANCFIRSKLKLHITEVGPVGRNKVKFRVFVTFENLSAAERICARRILFYKVVANPDRGHSDYYNAEPQVVETSTNNNMILTLNANSIYTIHIRALGFPINRTSGPFERVGTSNIVRKVVRYKFPPVCPQAPGGHQMGMRVYYSSLFRMGAVTWNKVAGATRYTVVMRRQYGNRREFFFNSNTNFFSFHRSQVSDGLVEFMVRSHCGNRVGKFNRGSRVSIRFPKSGTFKDSFDVEPAVDLVEESIIYPNTNNGNFKIKFKNNEKVRSVTIYDMLGQSVFYKTYVAKLEEDEYMLNGKLKSGMYKVIIQADNSSESKTLLVE